MLPPKASIALTADSENLWALTVNFFSNVPFPNILIPFNSFLTNPDSINNSGVTTSPSLNAH